MSYDAYRGSGNNYGSYGGGGGGGGGYGAGSNGYSNGFVFLLACNTRACYGKPVESTFVSADANMNAEDLVGPAGMEVVVTLTVEVDMVAVVPGQGAIV